MSLSPLKVLNIMNIFKSFTDPAIRHLMQLAEQRQQEAWRPGTQANHRSTITAFVRFAASFKIDFTHPSDELICAFLEHSLGSMKSPDSIKNMVSSLASCYRQMGLCDQVFVTFKVRNALTSISKNIRHVPQPAQPLPPVILKKALRVINRLKEGPTLVAGLVIMYHTLCRASNFCATTSTAFDPTRQFTRADVGVTQSALTIRHKWSKAHQQASHLTWITIPVIEGSPLCPRKAYCDMLGAVPTRYPHQPLMCFREGNHMPITYIRRIWNSVIQALRLPADKKYTLHSLRRGAATHIFNQDPSARNEIKKHGLWQSDCVDKYIPPKSARVFDIMKSSL